MSVCYRVALDMTEPLVVEITANSEEEFNEMDNDDLIALVLENDPGFKIVYVEKCA